MSASPPCATPPSAGPAPPTSANQALVPDTLLAAANMRRLLEVYRSLAPLTIGGPSSTSLETPGSHQLPGRPPPPPPPTDPRLLRKFAPYPWLMGPVFPPPGLQSPHMSSPWTSGNKPESGEAAPGPSHRKRHSSSDSGTSGQRPGRPGPLACGSPGPGSAPPVFSPRDKESSRLRHFVTLVCSQAGQCEVSVMQCARLVYNVVILASFKIT